MALGGTADDERAASIPRMRAVDGSL